MPAAPGRVAAMSASSRTRLTDLPPSSRKTGLRRLAAAAMMRWPVAVEPVKATMSTSGDVVSTSPTRWSCETTMFTTPAGMSVFSTMRRPRRVAFHGVSGAGLSTHVLPMASTGPSLLRMISIGKFHGTMTPTTPIGSFHTSRSVMSTHAEGVLGPERAGPLERVDHLGRPGQRLAQRGVELGAERAEDRAADLGDELGAQLLLLGLDGGLELEQALLAEVAIGGPRRWCRRRLVRPRSRRACRRRCRRRPGPAPPRWPG